MAVLRETGTGFGIDATDFKRFATALRKKAPQIAKQLRLDLKASAESIASEARANASAFSKSIPPTVKVRVSGVAVSVVAGTNTDPLAGLEELGNTGRRFSAATAAGGTFRHPVFGSATHGGATESWVDQKMHPFLEPAIQDRWPETVQAVVDSLDAAVASVDAQFPLE